MEYWRRGADAMAMGAEFNPPDNMLLRRAFAEGWAAEIMGLTLTDAEILQSMAE